MEVGRWVNRPDLTMNFCCCWKIVPKPVLMFWSSIPCVFCLYKHRTLLKVVGYYDLSVLSMSVMGFQKKKCGWGSVDGGYVR